MSDLHEASSLLHRAIGKLDEAQRTDSTQVCTGSQIEIVLLVRWGLIGAKSVNISTFIWFSSFFYCSFQTVQRCMIDQQTLMKDVLEDSRLVKLQREGGAILARLRKESDLKYPYCEDFR